MNANPLDRNEPSANGTSGFQTAGALVGMLLIFAGVALCAFLVIRIVGAYNSPEEFNDRLNKWEMVVSGVSGDMGQGISIEKTEPIQVGSEPADGNTNSAADSDLHAHVHTAAATGNIYTYSNGRCSPQLFVFLPYCYSVICG